VVVVKPKQDDRGTPGEQLRLVFHTPDPWQTTTRLSATLDCFRGWR
jgi:hypothetical protein